MKFAYNCKFCGNPGIVTGDDEGLKMVKPEIWLPRICCNRCGDYMVSKRKLTEAIVKTCRIIESCRINLGPEKRAAVETRCREQLVDLSKRFATMVCNYYRLTNIWEQQFADMLADKPDKCTTVLSMFIQGMAKESKSHQKQ